MKNRLLLGWVLGILPFLASAQSDSRIAPTQTPLSQVERLVMPPLNNKALYEAELERRGPGVAPRFAEAIEVDIRPEERGAWEILPDDRAVWRLRIHSAGAKSLNLGFMEYYMPPRGSLILYSPDQQYVLGPFTPADNEEHDQLWTPILPGDELVVEVQLPKNLIPQLQLRLSYVNHDFLGFGELAALSGSCNLDVICSETDGWGIVDDYRDIIQSVAVIGTGGTTFCSGFLVNNAEQDCRPFFMTAFHCQITQASAPSLVAYWNYQNSFCRQPGSPQSGAPGDGVLTDFNTGAIWRAGFQLSDFTLVELDDPVSETADAFFAGWSAEPVAPTNAICVHHPNTEEKRISFENDPLMLTQGGGTTPSPNFDHVRVVDWDVGTTEPGSSGAPLFDQNKRVVGQLDFGGAACGNNFSDWFGSFARSWEGGGTNTSRLRNWLDPNNTGILTLDGRSQVQCNFFVEATETEVEICSPANAVYTIAVSEIFTGTVTLSVSGQPAGTTASFSTNPVLPGGTSTLTIGNTGSAAPGMYTMTISGTDGVDVADSEIQLTIYDTAPGILSLSYPPDQSTSVETQPIFSWAAAPQGQTYQLVVALDPGLTNLVANETGLGATTYSGLNLASSVTYYWRVRGINSCGNGPWSDTFSFTTGAEDCSNQPSTNVPVTIPPVGTPTISSTLNLAVAGTITDVNVVDLMVAHTWVSDLTFTLTSPEGTSVVLLAEICEDENNFDLNFDDDGAVAIPCPPVGGGTYKPVQPLSTFNGENPQGVWTLTISDAFDEDGGSLNSWGLEICVIADAFVSVDPAQLAVCEGETATFELDVSSGFAGPVSLTFSGLPAGAVATVDPAMPAPGQTATVTLENLSGPGIYTVSVDATDGPSSASTELSLQLVGAPPATFLSLPTDAAVDVDLLPAFTWQSNPGAQSYLLEVSEDPAFGSFVIFQPTNNTTFTPLLAFEELTTYYWRVTAIGDCGETVSESFEFQTRMISSVQEIGGATFLLSPNPAGERVRLLFSQPLSGEVDVSLFAVDGRLLQQFQLEAGQSQREITLDEYPGGVYLLQLSTPSAVATQRIVVQR